MKNRQYQRFGTTPAPLVLPGASGEEMIFQLENYVNRHETLLIFRTSPELAA